jgi:hypothetical protein
MDYAPLISLSSLLFVALVSLALSNYFAWKAAHANSKSMEMLASVIQQQSTELRRSGDRVLAASNSVAYQTVKHFEDGKSQAAALNNREQAVTRI